MKKIYIAGKVTGMEDEARELFRLAEQQLLTRGYYPVNPMALRHDHDKRWESYMREAITAMLTCDSLLMLQGWEHSIGARIEHSLAEHLKMEILYQRSQQAQYATHL